MREHSDNDPGGDETKEVEEVVAAFANAAIVESGGHPTNAAVSLSSVSGDVRRRGAAGRIKEAGAPPRRSPSSMSNITGVGVSGQKTKNSTNRERGSISKAVERVVESIESGVGVGGDSNMMILMLSMQIQQSMQHFTMQQVMFQQMQMQMSAIEKHTEMNEKYCCLIAKSLGQKKSTREVRRVMTRMRMTVRIKTIR